MSGKRTLFSSIACGMKNDPEEKSEAKGKENKFFGERNSERYESCLKMNATSVLRFQEWRVS